MYLLVFAYNRRFNQCVDGAASQLIFEFFIFLKWFNKCTSKTLDAVSQFRQFLSLGQILLR